MKKSVSVSVYKKNGQMLAVTNRRWGGFTLPGGKVEPNETPEEAAFRELEEETGLTASAMKYLGCSLFDNPKTKDAPFLVHHYEAIFDGWGDPKPLMVEEGTDPFWINPNRFYDDENSIFSNHYCNIQKLGVITKRYARAVMD